MKDLIVDFSEFDENRPIFSRQEIEQLIPHRFELSLLDGVLFEDLEGGRCVGYCDVTDDAFWVRGHFPNLPLMPGVLICETAAQLCSFFASRSHLIDFKVIALGGLDEVRFRAPVRPGDRLVTMLRREKVRPNVMIVGNFQCFVRQQLACEGTLRGVVLNQE